MANEMRGPSPPPYPPGPPQLRRLTRSSHERMWAGVAGGMAEYFELDPAIVRLLWVAAAVVTGGLAVPVYILAWIILPRDDRSIVGGQPQWRDWSQEFHSETQRLAEEARRVADDMRGAGQTWRAPGPDAAPPSSSGTATDPATGKSAPSAASAASTASNVEPDPWWTSERYVERHRHHARHPRSTGIVLVVLGVLLLAANAGIFSWIEWRTMWPLIFIGLGLILLARQAGWNR